MSEPDNSLTTHASLLILLNKDGSERDRVWDEFYKMYAPIIAGFARKMAAKPGDIGDLVQEVLLGFVSVAPQFVYDRSLGRFRGYLKACTWRVFQRHLASQQLGGRRYESIDADDLAIEHTWNDIWETEKLQRALEIVRTQHGQRPDKRRTFEAFQMYVMLERPADEVAASLNMNIASVHQAKTRISGAIAKAMQELDEAMG